jgi:hypothetical protein
MKSSAYLIKSTLGLVLILPILVLPTCVIYFSSPSRAKLASAGEQIAPCGVPSVVAKIGLFIKKRGRVDLKMI